MSEIEQLKKRIQELEKEGVTNSELNQVVNKAVRGTAQAILDKFNASNVTHEGLLILGELRSKYIGVNK